MSNHKTQDIGRESLPTNADGPWTMTAIGVGVLTRKARGVWILVSGTLNFKDGNGTSQSLSTGYLTAGVQYPMEMIEIEAGTTATGKVLY